METKLDVSAELRDLAKKENVFGRLAASFLLELADRLDDERRQRETEDAIADKKTDDLRAEVARLTAVFTDMANDLEGDDFWPVVVKNIRAALIQPAPAQPCRECGGTRRVETEEFGRIICPMCKDEPAPAQE